MVLLTSGSVSYPLIISTNFITGTGFIKCIPITCCGLLVTEAIFVMEMDDVFEARMALAGAKASNCLNNCNLMSIFSVAASTTRAACCTPFSIVLCVTIFWSVSIFFSSVRIPFPTCRSKFFAMVAIALSN